LLIIGLVALQQLGVAIEVYYASEIDPDALTVTQTRQKMTHLGCVMTIDVTMVMKNHPSLETNDSNE